MDICNEDALKPIDNKDIIKAVCNSNQISKVIGLDESSAQIIILTSLC